MRDIYSLLRIFGRMRSRRLRLLCVYVLYLTRRRYLGLYFDPVQACNLRCKMCYFSGEKKPKSARMNPEDYTMMARALFRRVLKLQIGCGAEPTLCRELPMSVRTARQYGIPFISLTTNGMLLFHGDKRRVRKRM